MNQGPPTAPARERHDSQAETFTIDVGNKIRARVEVLQERMKALEEELNEVRQAMQILHPIWEASQPADVAPTKPGEDLVERMRERIEYLEGAAEMSANETRYRSEQGFGPVPKGRR